MISWLYYCMCVLNAELGYSYFMELELVACGRLFLKIWSQFMLFESLCIISFVVWILEVRKCNRNLWQLCSGSWLFISKLTVVSREAKKGQSDRQKQSARQTTVCLLHEQTFSLFDVIITVNISRATSTFQPALKTQNLLANINQHPKDKSNWLNSLSFPAWSKSMNFVFTFFFFDGSSQLSFLNRHISLKLAVLLGLS